MYRMIPGYRIPYRISTAGTVEKQVDGVWIPLGQHVYSGRAVVNLLLPNKGSVRVTVAGLMADAYLGGRKPGYKIIHRSEDCTDNSLRNLELIPLNTPCRWMNRHRRAVRKVDREGNILAFYKSIQAAADANGISASNVWRKCKGQVVDPFWPSGYTFTYDEEKRGPKAQAAPVIKKNAWRRPVRKMDRDHNVVARYPSIKEAAKANYASSTSISRRCKGRVADPYWPDGYAYCFDDQQGRGKK